MERHRETAPGPEQVLTSEAQVKTVEREAKRAEATPRRHAQHYSSKFKVQQMEGVRLQDRPSASIDKLRKELARWQAKAHADAEGDGEGSGNSVAALERALRNTELLHDPELDEEFEALGLIHSRYVDGIIHQFEALKRTNAEMSAKLKKLEQRETKLIERPLDASSDVATTERASSPAEVDVFSDEVTERFNAIRKQGQDELHQEMGRHLKSEQELKEKVSRLTKQLDEVRRLQQVYEGQDLELESQTEELERPRQESQQLQEQVAAIKAIESTFGQFLGRHEPGEKDVCNRAIWFATELAGLRERETEWEGTKATLLETRQQLEVANKRIAAAEKRAEEARIQLQMHRDGRDWA